MPLNIPGLLTPLQLLVYPRIVIPNVLVKDIRYLDFAALRKAGYRGAVFDKDNCLTIPDQDTLVPELQTAWNECRRTFGEGNVLIVSNSAGTFMDPGGFQAESVSYHLQVPVLQHNALKPAYSCVTSIRAYFSSLHRPVSDDELVIVGDRIFTDVVLANRMRLTNPKLRGSSLKSRGLLKEAFSNKEGNTTEKESAREKHMVEGRGPLVVWTTGVWQREAMGMRWVEKKTVEAVEKWSARTPGEGGFRDASRFIRRIKLEEPKLNVLAQLWSRLTRV